MICSISSLAQNADLNIDYTGVLEMVDYNDKTDHYLATDFTNGAVLMIDEHGEIQNEINYEGIGYGQFQFIMHAGFYSDSILVARDEHKIIFYSSEGKPINEIKLDDSPSLMNNKKKIFTYEYEGNSYMIDLGLFNTELSPAFMDFYDEINFIKVLQINDDLNIEEQYSGIGFPRSSPYITNRGVYTKVFPEYFLDESKLLLYVCFPLDETIYVYDVRTLKLLSSHSISLEHFNSTPNFLIPEYFEYPDNDKQYELEQQNSRIEDVFLVEDNTHILIHYSRGLNVDQIQNDRSSSYKSFLKRKHYIAKFELGKDNIKKIYEQELPDDIKVVELLIDKKLLCKRASISRERGKESYQLVSIN